MITALIDGDWIIYAAGFAGQKTNYLYVSEHGTQSVANVTEAKALCADTGEEYQPTALYSNVVVDKPEFVYHSAKNMLESAIRKIEDKCGTDVDPVVLVDGDGNFRSRIATIRPYKGTRNVHAKPVIYNELRQYLIDAWDAEVVYDQETDDEMAIRQSAVDPGKSIIVSLDKDMLQVRGLHYNPNKGFLRMTERKGELRLYVQAAMGDPVDNIGGAYKCGVKKAQAAFDVAMPEDEKWARLVDVYQESIDKYGDEPYRGLDATAAALENMRLVYLRRKPGELWVPPHHRS